MSRIARHIFLGTLLVTGCSSNRPPQLQPLNGQVLAVGNRFEIEIVAADPDGDRLSFSYQAADHDLGSRAEIVPLESTAIFSWTPNADDVGEQQIDFTVNDGTATDLESVLFQVRPSALADSVPVFRRPLQTGFTLDLKVQSCLSVDILVEDNDSTQVAISQENPLAGSTLKQVSPFSATFSWCPDEDQKKISQHRVRLKADDGDNPPVTKEFVIIVFAKLDEGCTGTAPTIQHTLPQPGAPIEAVITDDKGLKNPPLVYYSFQKPPDLANLDLSVMQTVTMTPAGAAGQYVATIPLPQTCPAPGETINIYYLILAEDDDDPAGNCDHRTLYPDNGIVEVQMTSLTPTVAITELMVNPSAVADNVGEWLELYNYGETAINLKGWYLDDQDFDTHQISTDLVIQPKQYVTLGNNPDAATNGGVLIDYVYPKEWVLANGEDEIVLYGGNECLVDYVQYSGSWSFKPGATLSLKDPRGDNNVASNWCTESTAWSGSKGDRGTPHAAAQCK